MRKAKQELNIISDLFYRSFSPKQTGIYYKIPYVSIILLIVAIILKTIQKINDDTNYMQNIILGDNFKQGDYPFTYGNPVTSFLLFYLDAMGVNSFYNINGNSTATGIIMLLINYPLLMLIETKIGHAYLAYFIIVLLLYSSFAKEFRQLVCYDPKYNSMVSSPYCCFGSVFFYATIGFVLAILLYYAHGRVMKSIIFSISLLTWCGILIYEHLVTFKDEDDNYKWCLMYYWKCMDFVFGFLTGLILAKC